MANIKSFPNNQDEYIGAEYVMKWLHGRTSGVFAAQNNASVTAVQNEMAVNLSDGLGWMANAGKDGVVWWIDHEAVNGAKLKLPIDAADSTLNRIDRIIVEWKTTNYVDLPEVKVLKGSLASSAKVPALTNDSTVRQISLAQIKVNAGTTEITSSMITDERLNASVCGLVTESITIDTTVIQNQFEALLNQIKKNLEETVSGEIASGSVTREKLATDALYSPVVIPTELEYTLTTADIGKTLRAAQSSATNVILTSANAEAMPFGAEIAILRYKPEDGYEVTITFDGVNVVSQGWAQALASPTLRISEGFAMIALKKITAAGTWVVTGSVEVVE